MKDSQEATGLAARAPFHNLSRMTLGLSAVAAVGLGVCISTMPGWNFSLVLSMLLATCVLIPTLRNNSMSRRITIFFSLLAVCEFVKKATFLVPGQKTWSQYLIFILPSIYYGVFVLFPWTYSKAPIGLSRLQKIVVAYIAVALLNTWLSPSYPLQAKTAATVLLIMPWSMLLVSHRYCDSISNAARALVGWGILSSLYGFWQFFLGPTIVERNWAEAAGELSIGARHLAGFMDDGIPGISVWRVTGMQPDALTFSMFLMTAFFSAYFLKVSGRMKNRTFHLLSAVLVAGIGLSLVRTIWVAFVAASVFAIFSRRIKFLSRPGLLFIFMVVLFFIADILATFFYANIFGRYPAAGNPIIVRALTVGTLESRMGSVGSFLSALPERAVLGLGYASSTWISGKFGGVIDLQSLVDKHNIFIELLRYVGLPGLVLFLFLLYELSKLIGQSLKDNVHSSEKATHVISWYLIGLLVSGFGNGCVFLSYHFFFFFGALAGISTQNQNQKRPL